MEFYTDSVESVRRLADRINIKCVQQLGFSWPSDRARKESNWTKDSPPRFTTLATQTDQSLPKPENATKAPLEVCSVFRTSQ